MKTKKSAICQYCLIALLIAPAPTFALTADEEFIVRQTICVWLSNASKKGDSIGLAHLKQAVDIAKKLGYSEERFQNRLFESKGAATAMTASMMSRDKSLTEVTASDIGYSALCK